jgi:hypothetical protein
MTITTGAGRGGTQTFASFLKDFFWKKLEKIKTQKVKKYPKYYYSYYQEVLGITNSLLSFDKNGPR